MKIEPKVAPWSLMHQMNLGERPEVIFSKMGAIPPSAILSRKGIARYAGVSRIGPLRSWVCSIC